MENCAVLNNSTEELNSRFKDLFRGTELLKTPFPYVVIDNFLPESLANNLEEKFPKVNSEWIHYFHYNERKFGLNKLNQMPNEFRQLVVKLTSHEFCEELSNLTGISNLIGDTSLEGAGLHVTKNGGFLNPHIDFNTHPSMKNLKRRVNLILYFNRSWLPEYNGSLELYDPITKLKTVEIQPLYNRCAIFITNEDSLHGSALPLSCPEGVERRSLALYYYTFDSKDRTARTTTYRATANSSITSKVLIHLDNKLIQIYSVLKTKMIFNENSVSKLLRFFFRQSRE